MPIESKNNIRNKILQHVENTAAFSKENAKNLLMLLDKKWKKMII